MQTPEFREPSVTGQKDNVGIDLLKTHLSAHSSSLFNKLDNFPRYVQTRTVSRFIARFEVFQKQLTVPGSIIEVGVGRGNSLFEWAHLSSIYEPVNITRRIIGFDTFSGISSHHDNDNNGLANTLNNSVDGFVPEPNTYLELKESIECFHQTKPLPHIPLLEVIKGDAVQTVPEYLDANPSLLISLLHIDVDIYAPTLSTLESCFKRMSKGSVILFDELCSHAYPGETIAVREFFALNDLNLTRFPFATTLAYAII